MDRPLRWTTVLLGVVALGGCRTGAAPASRATAPARTGVVLAHGDGFTITDAFFAARWSELCVAPKSAPKNPAACLPENRRALLDNLIRFELLAVEARRRNLQDDPEIALTLDKLMVQKLIRTEFSSAGNRADQEKAFEAMVRELRARASVEVDEASLNEVALPAPSGASPDAAPAGAP